MGEKKIKFVEGNMFHYEIYDLIDCYSDELRNKLEPFNFSNPPIDPKYLASSLIETMVKNNGVGLSANQVGLPYRVFVMGADQFGIACFNPEIIKAEGEESFEEGCLSFPGLFLPIKRPNSVEVRYTDMNGQLRRETFNGFTARLFLHEYDHMEGIVYTSKVSPIILDRQKKKIKAFTRKLQEQKFAAKRAQKKQAS